MLTKRTHIIHTQFTRTPTQIAPQSDPMTLAFYWYPVSSRRTGSRRKTEAIQNYAFLEDKIRVKTRR